jgi:hypothetical protein
MEFPQHGGRMVGTDIKGPLGGETLNFPPLQVPPPGCELGFTDRQARSNQGMDRSVIVFGFVVLFCRCPPVC